MGGSFSSLSPPNSPRNDKKTKAKKTLKNGADFTSEYNSNLHRAQEKNNSKAYDRLKVNSTFLKSLKYL